jgi:hypothetical protein
MKVTERVLAHGPDGETRWFEAGDEIPKDWEDSITNKSVIESDDEDSAELERWPEYAALKSVESIVGWVDLAVGDPDEQLARAEFAYGREEDTGRRPTLLQALESRLMALRG